MRLVLWPIETLYRISLRIETLDVPPQDIITRDNVSAKINAVCYFRVVDANLAVSQVQNYLYATHRRRKPPCGASSGSLNYTTTGRLRLFSRMVSITMKPSTERSINSRGYSSIRSGLRRWLAVR